VLYLRDGTTRRGTIDAQTESEIRLRLDTQGIRASITIPRTQVQRVETIPDVVKVDAPAQDARDPRISAPDSPHLPAPSAGPYAALQAKAAEDAAAARSTAAGWSLFGPATTQPAPSAVEELPAPLRDSWLGAIRAESLGDAAGTLEALRILEAGSREIPAGPERLEAFCRKVRAEGYGEWMGRVHWGLIKDKYRAGAFDLRDVREPERPVLIAQLRGKTAAAIEPLKPYFPQIDANTGRPEPFSRKQLEGITAANALEVKEQAALASAVLQGQLKLEPDMLPSDRALVGGQLLTVSRILSRARDLEPAAKMAIQKAEIEQQRAQAKARQEEARTRAAATFGLR
jgi:hypothetical protein